MAALFPAIQFEFLSDGPGDLDVLFLAVDGAVPEEIEDAVRLWLGLKTEL